MEEKQKRERNGKGSEGETTRNERMKERTKGKERKTKEGK